MNTNIKPTTPSGYRLGELESGQCFRIPNKGDEDPHEVFMTVSPLSIALSQLKKMRVCVSLRDGDERKFDREWKVIPLYPVDGCVEFTEIEPEEDGCD